VTGASGSFDGGTVETTDGSETGQTASDPCPDGYVSAGKEEADELGI
jgi:hypothetical protein